MAPEDGSLYDPKQVGVKEFYVIVMCFLLNMCMSWLLLTLILSMHGSTMKNIFFGFTGKNLRLLAYQLASVINLLFPFSSRAVAGAGWQHLLQNCRTDSIPLPKLRTVSSAGFRV
jgi:hypothetical protein